MKEIVEFFKTHAYWIRVIITPLLAGFVGYITNFLAVRLLFRPRNPVNILGYKLQGLLPKRRLEFIEAIAAAVERDMLNVKDFTSLIEKVDLKSEIKKIIDKYIDDKIVTSTSDRSIIGRAYNSILNSFKNRIKERLTNEINDNVASIISSFIAKMETDFDIKEIIIERMKKFDMDALERVVFSFSGPEMNFIVYSGAVLGFIIGLLQSLMIILLEK